MWSKKVHVKSSLESQKEQYHLFIGRWQSPNGLHIGHKALFEQVLNEGGNVLIAIRETEKSDKNPYSSDTIFDFICAEYKTLINEKRVKVIIIPDICSVNFGRSVGYDIIEHVPPNEISQISATKLRQQSK